MTLWAATRVGFLALAGLICAVAPNHATRGMAWYAWPFQVYARFDAGHFERIAAHGYLSRGTDDVNVAFFPGYPLAARYLADGFGLGHTTALDRSVALALLAWLGAAVAAVLLWKHVAERYDPRTATASVLVLLAGPYSLFLMASYSEALFLAFGLGAWLCAYRGRWWWAGALCAAATLVRVNGLFLLAGIAVCYVLDARRNRRRLVRPDLVPLALPLAAVGGYLAWLRYATGRWDAWFAAQRLGWGRYTTTPWRTLRNSIEHYRHTADPALHFQAVMELGFAALFVVSLVVLARHRLWPELTYVGLTALALLTNAFYQSVPRSTLVAFPMLVAAARWATACRHRSLVVLAASASTVLLGVNVACFVRGYIAG